MIFVCRQVQRHHQFEDRSFFFGCRCIRRTGPLSDIRPASCAPCLDPLPDFGDDCPPDLNGTWPLDQRHLNGAQHTLTNAWSCLRMPTSTPNERRW